MLKDIKHEISLDCCDRLVGTAGYNNEGLELIAHISVSLLDNYLFINTKAPKNVGFYIGRKHKIRKYIIVREKYLNEWSSTLETIETNNKKFYDEFIDETEKAEKEGYGEIL